MSPHRGLFIVGIMLVLAACAMMPDRLAGEAVQVTTSHTIAAQRHSINFANRTDPQIVRPRS